MLTFTLISFIVLPLCFTVFLAQAATTANPDNVQLGPVLHKSLPANLLKRIKATTGLLSCIDMTTSEII